MYTGLKLQPVIQVVLLRVRLWKYVFTTNIKLINRQILVHLANRDYQRILWQYSSTSAIDEYQLCAVTYVILVAPYQALRTEHELVIVDGPLLPLAATVIFKCLVCR